jgi:hypothetical protein
MTLTPALKRVYLKNSLFLGIFIGIGFLHFFLLHFYSNKLLGKTREINAIKDQIMQAQISSQKETNAKRIINLIQQKSGKDLSSIIVTIQQKINHNFETTKNLFSTKIQKENWQLKGTNFNQQENKLNFTFQIPLNDFDNFYNYLIDSGLVWQVSNFKINKLDNFWDIDLTFQSK